MSSTIKVNNIQNLAGDDSGIDLSTNDQIILKTANTTAITVNSSQNVALASTATIAGNTTITNGNLVLGTAGKGIDFSATSDASGRTSELLDFYEEGTWTPAFDDAGGGTFGYATQSGTYTRIGRLVYCQFNIVVNSVSGLSGSIMRLTGQPFSSNSDENMLVTRYQGFTSGRPLRGNASGSSSVNIKSEGTNDNGNFPSSNTTASSQLIGLLIYTAS